MSELHSEIFDKCPRCKSDNIEQKTKTKIWVCNKCGFRWV